MHFFKNEATTPSTHPQPITKYIHNKISYARNWKAVFRYKEDTADKIHRMVRELVISHPGTDQIHLEQWVVLYNLEVGWQDPPLRIWWKAMDLLLRKKII